MVNTTFGALAIGDRFQWRDTDEIQHGGPGPEMTKTAAKRYEWLKGYGTAEPHYPVRRLRRRAASRPASDPEAR